MNTLSMYRFHDSCFVSLQNGILEFGIWLLLSNIPLLVDPNPEQLSFEISRRYLILNLSSQPLLAIKSGDDRSSRALSLIIFAVTYCLWTFRELYQSNSFFSISGSFVFRPPPFFLYHPTFIHLLRDFRGTLYVSALNLGVFSLARFTAYLLISGFNILYLLLFLREELLKVLMASFLCRKSSVLCLLMPLGE